MTRSDVSPQLQMVQLLSAHLPLQVLDHGLVPALVGRHVGVDRAGVPVVVLPAGHSHGAGALDVGVGVAVAGHHVVVGGVVVVDDVAVLAVARRLGVDVVGDVLGLDEGRVVDRQTLETVVRVVHCERGRDVGLGGFLRGAVRVAGALSSSAWPDRDIRPVRFRCDFLASHDDNHDHDCEQETADSGGEDNQ